MNDIHKSRWFAIVKNRQRKFFLGITNLAFSDAHSLLRLFQQRFQLMERIGAKYDIHKRESFLYLLVRSLLRHHASKYPDNRRRVFLLARAGCANRSPSLAFSQIADATGVE